MAISSNKYDFKFGKDTNIKENAKKLAKLNKI